MTVFNQYARYYDLIYSDKNYAAEADYIAGTIRRFAPETARILEFGSGTGIHGKLLAGRGYQVIGIERSADMVDRAINNRISKSRPDGGSFDCLQGDIRQSHVESDFDAVIALFHVVSYQVSNEDVLATFQNASRHLNHGGFFWFDIWYTPAVHAQRPAVRIKRMENDQVRLVRIAEPVTRSRENIVEIHYTIYIEEKSSGRISSFAEVHPMRHFSLPELELLAARSGFCLVQSEEFLTGMEPGENTWGVWCGMRRIK
jgi:SAM-dependent methyltransferase